MTKSEQILSLYDGKRSTSEIAAIVGCRREYVRVVARQRKGKGVSDVERRYLESPLGKHKSRKAWRKQIPFKTKYITAWRAEMKRSGDRETACAAGRAAYHKAKQS